ncbi:MAG: hypothetical protein KDD85_05790 [Parvularculaceae bacterium]|nr:hypothetical protein [Parvularculaceae bacterium]
MAGNSDAARGADGAHGYLSSAFVFAGITALWAVIVRDDPYYRLTDLFGVRVPSMLIAYLVLMPLAGLIVGRWRYQARHRGGAAGYMVKLGARVVQFTYVHLLIVLFTLAMATDYFLGLNIDEQVRTLDDRLFDLAARFAPWLAAYLTGFNLGRAMRADASPQKPVSDLRATNHSAIDDKAEIQKRAEPAMGASFFKPADSLEQGDLSLSESEDFGEHPPTSGADDAASQAPGFLAPQDFDSMRPKLNELR